MQPATTDEPNPTAPSTTMMIDETYEFSAPRFFDFIEDESADDKNKAELWFDSALTYAPSPCMPRIKTSRSFNVETMCDFTEAEHMHKNLDSSSSQSKLDISSALKEQAEHESSAILDAKHESSAKQVDMISANKVASQNDKEEGKCTQVDGSVLASGLSLNIKVDMTNEKENSHSVVQGVAACTPKPPMSYSKRRDLPSASKKQQTANKDQFDTIDLSDNEIVKLENLPYLNRLGTLIINNNRITRINPNIGEYLPKLHTLVLTNNRLVNLVEIDPLASLSKLQYLSLLDNNITKKPNYRLYVIHKLKSLRVLDFKKVKNKERLEAKTLFASKEVEEETRNVSPKKYVLAEGTDMTEEQQTLKVVAPTQDQINAIKAAIVNTQTLEEVARLEEALKSGELPAGLKILDDDTPNKDDEMVVANENDT